MITYEKQENGDYKAKTLIPLQFGGGKYGSSSGSEFKSQEYLGMDSGDVFEPIQTYYFKKYPTCTPS